MRAIFFSKSLVKARLQQKRPPGDPGGRKLLYMECLSLLKTIER